MPSSGPRTLHASRAFLVRATDMGEADRRITLFSESDGTVSLLGRSARKSRKRFGGVLQRYFLLDISWSSLPERMPVLEQAVLVASFWEIVEDWEKVRYADYLLELAVNLFPQPGPKPKAFEALYAGMRALALGDAPRAVAARTEAAMLAIAGWGPNLEGCRVCGSREQARFRFLLSEGSLACSGCSDRPGTVLSLGAVKSWRALQSSSPSVLGRIRLGESILAELQDVIPKYVEYCIGKQMRSLAPGESPSNR
ncbi:MAG TPA: DNA repair protein RecO [Candidatus Deferrimicrobiaceae bacterium]